MVPSPKASRTAPRRVSSKRPLNEPSEKAGRQSLHNCRRHALERTFVDWGRRSLRGAVVRGDREKEKEQEEPLPTINSNCITLEIERICKCIFPLVRMAEPNNIMTKEE
jgi:hypothetical protein